MPPGPRPAASLPRGAAAYAGVAAAAGGACLMIVEITASRVLAPVFGNTLHVWSAVIGLILAALSLGYALGGRRADRGQPLADLWAACLLAAVGVGLIPPLADALLPLLSRLPAGPLGPLLAGLLLFAAPGVLLGATSPLAVRLSTDAGLPVGRAAGRISALAALGSIAGTFAAGFVLLPVVGSRAVLLSVAAALTLLGLGGRWVARGRRLDGQTLGGLLLLGLLGAGLLAGPVRGPAGLAHQEESAYHRIRVLEGVSAEGRSVRRLLLDSTEEGAVYTDGPGLPFRYTRYVDLVELFGPPPRRAFFVGGGAFAMPRHLLSRFPQARVQVAELDPAVVRVARQHLGLHADARLQVLVGDGRRALRERTGGYDLVVGDAYRGLGAVPPHLTTREFYELVRARLSPEGVYLANLVSPADLTRAPFVAATLRTLAGVFPEVYVFRVPPEDEDSPLINVIVACPATRRDLSARSVHAWGQRRGHTGLTDTLVPAAGWRPAALLARELTDDFCPVEALVAAGLRG